MHVSSRSANREAASIIKARENFVVCCVLFFVRLSVSACPLGPY